MPDVPQANLPTPAIPPASPIPQPKPSKTPKSPSPAPSSKSEAPKPPTTPPPTASNSVDPTPLKPSTVHHKIFGIFVILTCPLILIALGFILWPMLNILQQPTHPATVPITTTTPTTLIVTSTPPIAHNETTSTSAVQATSTAPTIHQLGESVVLFKNDAALFAGHNGHTYTIIAMNFNDSRCPAGVQCVWAGELGMTLRIQKSTSESVDVYLGMSRAKSVTAYGLNIHLNDISEEKGGFAATITVK